MVKSISFDEQEILGWILQLHCESNIELDPTYSKGNFYKKGTIFVDFSGEKRNLLKEIEEINNEDL